MIRFRLAVVAALALGVTALFSAGPVSATPSHSLPPQAAAHVFKTKGNARPNRSNNLAYNGGVGGIGVETTPKVYLVLWGSQWNNNDPSGEAAREQILQRNAAAMMARVARGVAGARVAA